MEISSQEKSGEYLSYSPLIKRLQGSGLIRDYLLSIAELIQYLLM